MTKQTAQLCDSGAARHNTDCSDVARNRADGGWNHPLVIKRLVAATSGEVTPDFNPSHAQLGRGRVARRFRFCSGSATVLAKAPRLGTLYNLRVGDAVSVK